MCRRMRDICFDHALLHHRPSLLKAHASSTPSKVTAKASDHPVGGGMVAIDTPGVWFSRVKDPWPTVTSPNLLLVSHDLPSLLLADNIGIDAAAVTASFRKDKDFVEAMAGNRPINADALDPPVAHCYAGHQFGYFSGQLGDGAAIYLGQVIVAEEFGQRLEIQLKGAGLTPYARSGTDGRKVLRSSLREFVASEYMHCIGVPTTRALTLVTSYATKVARDQFYCGQERMEPVGIVSRAARSFLRFGSFEIFHQKDALTGRKGPSADLPIADAISLQRSMLSFTLAHHFPHIFDELGIDKTSLGGGKDIPKEAILAMFKEVVEKTAALVASWRCIGFCHGVLNTDNMSILGLTLDYGPYGYIEKYDPDWVCNSSDHQGRYAFSKQVDVCQWNLERFAMALSSDIDSGSKVQNTKLSMTDFKAISTQFKTLYEQQVESRLGQKFGFVYRPGGSAPHVSSEEQTALVRDWWELLTDTGADLTCSFRILSRAIGISGETEDVIHARRIALVEQILTWCYDVHDMQRKQRPTLPSHILQQMQRFLSTAESSMDRSSMLSQFAYQLDRSVEKVEHELKLYANQNDLAKTTPDDVSALADQHRDAWTHWLQRYQAHMSLPNEAARQRCAQGMDAVNPVITLRNHLLQHMIQLADQQDGDALQRCFDAVTRPYDEPDVADIPLHLLRPLAGDQKAISVSCSS